MDEGYSHAAMLQLLVCESDEAGGDVSLVLGQLLYAALIVAATARRPSGSTRETATAVSGLGHCVHTQPSQASQHNDNSHQQQQQQLINDNIQQHSLVNVPPLRRRCRALTASRSSVVD